MKTFWRVGGVWVVLVTAGLAAESNRNSEPRPMLSAGKSKTTCDPVCELRSQDAAFNLLVEAYRQHLAYNIQIDYYDRLEAIAAKRDPRAQFFIESNTECLQMLRQLLIGLAKRERELRLAKVETEVANFQAAYSCARKIDEDYLGKKVTKNFDRATAQAKLKEMVIISPGSLAKGDVTHARSIPASTVLLDLPVGPGNPSEIVPPCD